jgi:hypothetical protein
MDDTANDHSFNDGSDKANDQTIIVLMMASDEQMMSYFRFMSQVAT